MPMKGRWRGNLAGFVNADTTHADRVGFHFLTVREPAIAKPNRFAGIFLGNFDLGADFRLAPLLSPFRERKDGRPEFQCLRRE